jgi:type II restriction/modification system DNA methylase subunit YeeA
MLGYPHPAAADGIGERFTFEKPVSKVYGGYGFADVWLRDHFAWEYKESRTKKHKNLTAAYKQLNDYREELGNPPLLVVCDMDTFQVHTNFTATYKRVYEFRLDDLQKNQVTATCPIPPLDVLRALFDDYNILRPERTDARVTQDAARLFSRLAERLELEDRNLGASREQVAHFLMRILFCLFADSIGLLPGHLFRRLIQEDRSSPKRFLRKLAILFEAMSQPDGIFGEHSIKYFNGGLFDTASILALDHGDLGILYEVSKNYDWSHIAPAIFGTLFERSLDPRRRSLVGAHYTSQEDILLLIEPLLLSPLRQRWDDYKRRILEELEVAHVVKVPRGSRKSRLQIDRKPETLLCQWIEELTSLRILDPACGSGNFLYVALRHILDLWLEATRFAVDQGISLVLPKMVSPTQLYGIETEFYAHELASVVVWIGFLQWKHEHGVHDDREPILQKLSNIHHGDAILSYDGEGKLYEPLWPKVDFIIGNPPFLGGKLLRRKLGDKYVDDLFSLYRGRVKAESDLVVYWFEKARREVETSRSIRAGLLATQSIRGGANRNVLDRIQETAPIFLAWSDRNWMLEGAAVHVSMVCFGARCGEDLTLDGQTVTQINPDLTTGVDVTTAQRLDENREICFMGTTKVGAFDLEPAVARKMLTAPLNPNGRPNSDVIRTWINAKDFTGRPRGHYIIDFGTEMTQRDAALYELPFQYVKKHVYPERQKNSRSNYRDLWWLHGEPRPELRRALNGKTRYILTPGVSKHRIFDWFEASSIPDHAIFALIKDDDYFMGVIHSCVHESWARAQGTQVREVESGFRYTPISTFETFPFPWPPGFEPSETDDRRVKAIADAARELVRLRDAWLGPGDIEPAELKNRTLTRLYNERPTWLENAHQDLDRAVFGAYGWKYPLDRNELLHRLLALNHERANDSSGAARPKLPPKKAPGVERLPRQKPSERVAGR